MSSMAVTIRVVRIMAHKQYKAKAILMCAMPSHGKSTTLQALTSATAAEQREYSLLGHVFGSPYRPCPIRSFDPKKEVLAASPATLREHFPEHARNHKDSFGDRELASFSQCVHYDSAQEAVEATLSDMRGICIIEELLTVPPSEFRAITHLLAIRRTSTEGMGPTIYLTTQRPHGIPVAARAIVDEIWIGRIEEQRDLVALEGHAGKQIASVPYLAKGKWVIHRQ